MPIYEHPWESTLKPLAAKDSNIKSLAAKGKEAPLNKFPLSLPPSLSQPNLASVDLSLQPKLASVDSFSKSKLASVSTNLDSSSQPLLASVSTSVQSSFSECSTSYSLDDVSHSTMHIKEHVVQSTQGLNGRHEITSVTSSISESRHDHSTSVKTSEFEHVTISESLREFEDLLQFPSLSFSGIERAQYPKKKEFDGKFSEIEHARFPKTKEFDKSSEIEHARFLKVKDFDKSFSEIEHARFPKIKEFEKSFSEIEHARFPKMKEFDKSFSEIEHERFPKIKEIQHARFPRMKEFDDFDDDFPDIPPLHPSMISSRVTNLLKSSPINFDFSQSTEDSEPIYDQPTGYVHHSDSEHERPSSASPPSYRPPSPANGELSRDQLVRPSMLRKRQGQTAGNYLN